MKYKLAINNFEKQQSIFDDPARYKIVAKGRRFGLTKGAANDFIRKGLTGQFSKGLWVDTVHSNIERYVERYFLPHLSKLPPHLWSWRKQQKILQIRDAYIDFRSADNPYNIEGFGYDKYFLNEAGIILRNEYLWSNAIQPMLWDYKAEGVIGGAPKGKGVFFELFQRGQDADQPDYKSFRFTSFDNPYIQQDQIMEDIKSMPQRVVEQEIYAQFLDDSGVVFRGVKEVAILTPKEPHKDHIYVIGCDLAKVQDYTVLAVYDRKTNDQVCQMRFNQLEWPTQKERIKMLSQKYNNALVLADGTGIGDPIVDDLLRAGVPVEPIHLTNETKKQIIEKLSNWIELKNFKMLNLDETINELNSFTYDISSTGKIRYNAPVGFHDDIVIAHALAVWSLQPISHAQKEAELSIIQQDLYEKKKAFSEGDDFFEYESI